MENKKSIVTHGETEYRLDSDDEYEQVFAKNILNAREVIENIHNKIKSLYPSSKIEEYIAYGNSFYDFDANKSNKEIGSAIRKGCGYLILEEMVDEKLQNPLKVFLEPSRISQQCYGFLAPKEREEFLTQNGLSPFPQILTGVDLLGVGYAFLKTGEKYEKDLNLKNILMGCRK
ncbi:MAG: hypothetical protein KKF50_02295 [Nanoarchaeota archaeon]|nr:hypothetical protein [Nanoarchaeota archaeon]